MFSCGQQILKIEYVLYVAEFLPAQMRHITTPFPFRTAKYLSHVNWSLDSLIHNSINF